MGTTASLLAAWLRRGITKVRICRGYYLAIHALRVCGLDVILAALTGTSTRMQLGLVRNCPRPEQSAFKKQTISQPCNSEEKTLGTHIEVCLLRGSVIGPTSYRSPFMETDARLGMAHFTLVTSTLPQDFPHIRRRSLPHPLSCKQHPAIKGILVVRFQAILIHVHSHASTHNL